MDKLLKEIPTVPIVEERVRHSMVIDLTARLVREKPLGTIGAVIVLMFLLVGVFANFLAPYGFNDVEVMNRLQPPSGQHLLGTDGVGRDLLSRIIHGARVSMFVGLGSSTVAVLLATVVGMISGYFGRWVDVLTQRFVDAFMCFPALFLILTTMAVIGQGTAQVIAVLGLVYGIGNARVVRSAVIGIRQNIYMEAAKAIGASDSRVLRRHILPNIIPPIIILFTINIGAAIIAEATISFLGFGIPPPTPSWGGMLSEGGRAYLLLAPWMALWPGLALGVVVFGVNMFGDAIRDIVDPRLRGTSGRYKAAGPKKPKLTRSGYA